MNAVVRKYLETALWSSTDDNGEPLDKKYKVEDFDAAALKQAEEDCTSFVQKVRNAFIGQLAFNGDLPVKKMGGRGSDDGLHLMYDFWLTRNRHGAGFWDGDYDEMIGKMLTEIAHTYGECNIYVNDEGKLSMM